MPVIGLSHPRAVTRIPDPIHGVIELTIFDRDIVDSKAFQRLHFVLQQSVSYVSFPANKNTRFPHSLGTAHLAGRLFSQALSNSETVVLKDFLDISADFIVKLADYLLPDAKGGARRGKKRKSIEEAFDAHFLAHSMTVSGVSRFLHSPLAQSESIKATGTGWRVGTEDVFGSGPQKLSAIFIIDTLWQALRIYALTHDIGHLPMSHAFESAVERVSQGLIEYQPGTKLHEAFGALVDQAKDEFSGLPEEGGEEEFFELLSDMVGADRRAVSVLITDKPLHEIRSFAILNGLLNDETAVSDNFNSLKKDEKKSVDDYTALIHNLALCIVYSPCIAVKQAAAPEGNAKSFLFALRQLVDGAIDGDRLDYTLRDCFSAGSPFGDFDLERIVRNAILVREQPHTIQNSRSRTKGTKKYQSFGIGFGPRAVAGIEQFFEARYQSYKYLVHHRTASRSNIVVEALIEKLFLYSSLFPDTECARLLERFGYIERDKLCEKIDRVLPVMTEEIQRIDDCSLRTLLHDSKRWFDGVDHRAEAEKDELKATIGAEISSLCSVVLFRDFNDIVTIFRHMTPESVFEKHLRMSKEDERDKFLLHLKVNLGEFFTSIRKQLVDHRSLGLKKPVTLLYEHVKPKVFSVNEDGPQPFEKQVWIRDPRGELLNLEDRRVSAGLHSMASERRNDTKVRVYAVAANLKGEATTQRDIEKVIIAALKEKLVKFREETRLEDA